MHADMAFIEMGDHGFRQRAGVFGLVDKPRVDGLFAYQNGHAGALGFIILAGDIQDISANNRAGLDVYKRQSLEYGFAHRVFPPPRVNQRYRAGR